MIKTGDIVVAKYSPIMSTGNGFYGLEEGKTYKVESCFAAQIYLEEMNVEWSIHYFRSAMAIEIAQWRMKNGV